MIDLRKTLALTGIAAALLATTSSAQAPPRIDFEEVRQRRMESYRERLEITADAEWKLIEGRINKINEARREAAVGGFGGGRGVFGRPQRDGNDGPGGGRGERGDGDRGGRRFGGAALPEFEELQKAIDAKSSPEEIKAKLAKLRDARKAKQANVVKAQDDLRKVLTVRQEAVAVMMGLLD